MRKKSLLIIVMATAMIANMAIAGKVIETPLPSESDGSKVILTWDEFVQITGFDPANKSANQVITVPWEDVEKLLGVKIERVGDGATVDLPWKEFRALLEYSLKNGKKPEEPAAPADYIISESNYTGTLSPDGAEFVLDLKINVLKKKGWVRIPVLPATVAMKSSKLPDGVHLNVNGGNYELLTANNGPIEASVVFAVAVIKNSGINTVSFDRPVNGSSVFTLVVEGGKADVKVAGAQSLNINGTDKKTTVAAALPSSVPVRITWERAIPKPPDAPTKMYAMNNTLVSVADGLLICHESINYNILHTAIRELTLKVPARASILTVNGSNVQSWRVVKDLLKVVLKTERKGSLGLNITYETATSSKGNTLVPIIRSQGVEREKGFVAVVAMANVEIGSQNVKAATSIDARSLPSSLSAMTNQPVLLGFRYVEEDVSIPLTIKKHDEISVLVTVADSLVATGMQLSDGRRMTNVLYSIRNNRNQFLRLKMPADSEIWSVAVAGKTVTPGKDKDGNVLIPLVRSKSSMTELTAFPVSLVYIEAAELKNPTSGTMKVNLPVCDVPLMHVMYNAYLPSEGKYTAGWGKSTFAGSLGVVEKYASMSTSTRAVAVANNAPVQAAQMQQQFNQQAEIAIEKTGDTPIRVKLPLDGMQIKLEKILALPGDDLWFSYNYTGWNP